MCVTLILTQEQAHFELTLDRIELPTSLLPLAYQNQKFIVVQSEKISLKPWTKAMDTGNIKSDAETSAKASQPLLHCSIIRTPGENGLLRSTLNNDCMAEIFKRMQTKDLLTISCFCEHCYDLVKNRIFPHRTINADDIHEMFDIREVFAQFGSVISDLIIHRRHIDDKSIPKMTTSDSLELLQMLTLNCPNDSLKKLDISLNFHEIHTKCLESFANKLQNVSTLEITGSHYHQPSRRCVISTNDNNHQLEMLLRKVEKLKAIQIKSMSICGSFLHRTPAIKHLTELAFVQCDRIQVDALIESAAHLKCLTNFVWQNSKFGGVDGASDNMATVCDVLGREFETVRAVSIHMNYGLKYCDGNNGERGSVLDGLKQLPHLKSVSIGMAGACACNNFYAVIQQLTQLKSLAIESPLLFGGRNCLPCEKIIGNWLPKIFHKLRSLTSLRIVRVNPAQTEHLINEISEKLQHIDELHLIGIRQFNEENLLSLVRNLQKLNVLSLNETRFNFTRELYMNLVNECQSRHLKIAVSQSVRRTILSRVAKHYRMECVQIVAID